MIRLCLLNNNKYVIFRGEIFVLLITNVLSLHCKQMFFEMKTTEFLKKAAKIGCYFVSHGKEHDVWYSPKTDKYFRVGRHGSQEIKGGTLNSMMKDAGLK